MTQKFILIKVRKAANPNVNEELQWLGNSLGLFNLRDKDSSCFRVFITFVRNAKTNTALSSDEIAEKLRLSRATVIHHLDKLMDAGIVVKDRQRYILRENSLQTLVKDLQQDMEAFFSELREVAKEIDEQLG
ncbi:hypothetical protein COV20_03400 [Candidatus Woesearchaeota archaeon CG10_big_fil_rev_8_21_14_0_10_45_16]|nr:MAG: hypothetical protein COV20_03400 [Candidatus Woesearchaeota archaeon CG10_big_fil_rev_8_21_14_0_10_45_16]